MPMTVCRDVGELDRRNQRRHEKLSREMRCMGLIIVTACAVYTAIILSVLLP